MKACSFTDAYMNDRSKGRLRKMWRGGRVAPDVQDDDLEVYSHDNSTGEPHTAGEDGTEDPMEFNQIDHEEETTPESTYDNAIGFFDALKRRGRKFSP